MIFLGILSGLAVYANYTISITFLTCLMLWFAIDKMFFLKKYFLKFTMFFLIGLIPWIAANIYFFPAGISASGYLCIAEKHSIYDRTKMAGGFRRFSPYRYFYLYRDRRKDERVCIRTF